MERRMSSFANRPRPAAVNRACKLSPPIGVPALNHPIRLIDNAAAAAPATAIPASAARRVNEVMSSSPTAGAQPLSIGGNECRCGLPRRRQQVRDDVLGFPLREVHASEFSGRMNGDELALENGQGTDRVHLVTILQHGGAEN